MNSYDNLYKENPNIFDVHDIMPFAVRFMEKGSVIDLGGGVGQNSLYLREYGFNPVLIDWSEEAVKQASESGIEAYKGSITDKSCTEYDYAFCLHVLHHLTWDEGVAVLEEMKKSKKGFVISFFLRDSEFYKEGYFYPTLEEVIALLGNDHTVKLEDWVYSSVGNKKNHRLSLVVLKR